MRFIGSGMGFWLLQVKLYGREGPGQAGAAGEKPAQFGPAASPKALAGSLQGRVKSGAVQVFAPA